MILIQCITNKENAFRLPTDAHEIEQHREKLSPFVVSSKDLGVVSDVTHLCVSRSLSGITDTKKVGTSA